MKTIAIAAAMAGLCAFAEDALPVVVSVSATMNDGSVIKGELKDASIECSTVFLEKLSLDPGIVRSLAFLNANGSAKVEFANGDKLTVSVANPAFKVGTVLGELNLPVPRLRSLVLTKKADASSSSAEGLVFHCTFDDETSITSPAVGPAGKIKDAIICPNEGKSGGALLVKAGRPAAELVVPANCFGEEGTIEFWAKLLDDKSMFLDGGDPRFFTLFDELGTERGMFEFASNDGLGDSGLCAAFFGTRCASLSGTNGRVPYSAVFKGKDYRGWHHYAMTWTSSSLKLLIDGEVITTAARSSAKVGDDMEGQSFHLQIPIRSRSVWFNNKANYMMDEFQIWNFAKTSFDS